MKKQSKKYVDPHEIPKYDLTKYYKLNYDDNELERYKKLATFYKISLYLFITMAAILAAITIK